MPRITFKLIAMPIAAILLLALCSGAWAADDSKPTRINKIYFLFHPICWTIGINAQGQPPASVADKASYLACYEWEKKVVERQKAFFKTMKSDEALVIFPISRHPSMLAIEEAAEKALGKRYIFVSRGSIDPQPDWTIDSFLNEPSLPGRDAFLKSVPQDIQVELANEIRAAQRKIPTPWNIGVLEVIYYSRLCAMDLLNEMKTRKLVFDPKTVKTEAFGEGFEQCAMTWKNMTVPYMGIKHPTPNIFDLSVTGAQFLVNAKLKERILLKNAVVLYTWEGEGGKLIGFYARSWCRLSDPQYYARVNVKGMPLQAWDITAKHTPADNSPLKMVGDTLVAPVLNGIRRDATDMTVYLIADGVSYSEFRKRLVRAAIAP